jgi:hypothetical protein
MTRNRPCYENIKSRPNHIFDINLSLINIEILKIKLTTGFCQNWVLLSINSNFNFLTRNRPCYENIKSRPNHIFGHK